MLRESPRHDGNLDYKFFNNAFHPALSSFSSPHPTQQSIFRHIMPTYWSTRLQNNDSYRTLSSGVQCAQCILKSGRELLLLSWCHGVGFERVSDDQVGRQRYVVLFVEWLGVLLSLRWAYYLTNGSGGTSFGTLNNLQGMDVSAWAHPHLAKDHEMSYPKVRN